MLEVVLDGFDPVGKAGHHVPVSIATHISKKQLELMGKVNSQTSENLWGSCASGESSGRSEIAQFQSV